MLDDIEGLTDDEIEEGYILACSARTQGKVIMDA